MSANDPKRIFSPPLFPVLIWADSIRECPLPGGYHAFYFAGGMSLRSRRVAIVSLSAGTGSNSYGHSQRSSWSLCRFWRKDIGHRRSDGGRGLWRKGARETGGDRGGRPPEQAGPRGQHCAPLV